MSLLKLLLLPFWYLLALLPRRKNLWVFGSNTGNSFGDSTGYFFTYIVENQSTITAVWITSSKSIYDTLQTQGHRVVLKDSWRAKWICLRAGKGFTTHGKNDLCNEFTNGIVLYNLWHGMPLKKIGHIPPKSWLKRCFYRVWYPQKWDYFFVTSDKFKPIMENYIINSYKPVEKLEVLGMPKYDRFYGDGEEIIISEYRAEFGQDVRFVLFCPTYREQNEFEAYSSFGKIDIFKEYDFNPDELQALMDSLNAVFLVKMHPMASDKLDIKPIHNRIKLIEGDEIDDVYYLMKDTAVLLSDYSSILFDFLVLDRPIIHTVFDLDLYKEIRAFNFDYKEIVAGPETANWAEAFKAIQGCLEQDEYKQLREEVNASVNAFELSKSYSRALYEFCISN